jgi:hypothetical protein
MTAEIAILNKNAVALAADSGDWGTRYQFRGMCTTGRVSMLIFSQAWFGQTQRAESFLSSIPSK